LNDFFLFSFFQIFDITKLKDIGRRGDFKDLKKTFTLFSYLEFGDRP
jgi:hypothetical protein